MRNLSGVGLGLALGVSAVAAAAPAAPIETRHLTVSAAVIAAASADGRVTLVLDVSPKRTMHVYAPPQQDYLPVSLTVPSDPTVKAAPPQFPKPETLHVDGLDETQSVYSHPFRIVQPVTLAPAARRRAQAAGGVTVKGTLRYQACDDTICYLPVSVPVTWTIALTPAGRVAP